MHIRISGMSNEAKSMHTANETAGLHNALPCDTKLVQNPIAFVRETKISTTNQSAASDSIVMTGVSVRTVKNPSVCEPIQNS